VFAKLAPSLVTAAIYGGAPYDPQERLLRRGVDAVVGTPGRMIDHIRRGNIALGSIRWAPPSRVAPYNNPTPCQRTRLTAVYSTRIHTRTCTRTPPSLMHS